MKRIFLLINCLIVICGITSAQDVVTLRSGRVFNAKIVSIEGEKITYVDNNDVTGSKKVLFSRDVYSIQYESGVTQVFNQAMPENTTVGQSQEKSTETFQGNNKSNYTNNPYPDVFSEYIIAAHFGDVFALRMHLDLGKSFEDIPVFCTLGGGMTFSSMDDYSSTSLRIPLSVGYLIGNSRKVHMDIRGGIGWNYLTSMKYKNDSFDLSGYDRSSWNGSVRVSFGYSKFSIFGQYDFSFQSNGGGSWFIGLCLM